MKGLSVNGATGRFGGNDLGTVTRTGNLFVGTFVTTTVIPQRENVTTKSVTGSVLGGLNHFYLTVIGILPATVTQVERQKINAKIRWGPLNAAVSGSGP